MKKIKDVLKKLVSTFKVLKPSVRLTVVLVLFLLVSYPVYTFSRYVYDLITYSIYNSQNFYFKSDFLAENNPEYNIANWDGADDYVLVINMNSVLNELKSATMDIDYDIHYECTGDVTCSIDKESSTIKVDNGSPTTNNRDSFTITMVPNHVFDDNEKAEISIRVNSTSPYEKELKGKFIIKVEKAGLAYEITDEENSVISVLRLTNSLTYYTVQTAFQSYAVGDIILNDDYKMLSVEDQEKCVSNEALLEFDPRVIQMDMTNQYFIKAKKNNLVSYGDYYVVKSSFNDYQNEDIISQEDYNSLSESNKEKVEGPYQYVNSMRVKINAISSVDIKFYKSDATQNYSFPSETLTPIVKVS